MLSTVTTISAETSLRHRRKYESKNPIQCWVMKRFHRTIRQWLDKTSPRRVLDFGCGEGYFWQALQDYGPLPDVVGLDMRADAIASARTRLPALTFVCEDLFSFQPASLESLALRPGSPDIAEPDGGLFDMVIASQVLEHLYEPALYLKRLCEFAPRHILLTVPHEPCFRRMNLLRGRDLPRWGNHPEHVQHWSRRSFLRFVSRYIEIEEFECRFPFLMVLGHPKPRVSVNESPRQSV